MNRRTLTTLLVVGVIAVLLAWDFYIALQGEWDATVSNVVSTLLSNRTVAFLAGMVMGHFVWPIADPVASKPESPSSPS